MSIWGYSKCALYRSVHSYTTLIFKQREQILVEVTGKQRNKAIMLEIPASYTFNYKKPSKMKRLNST